MSKKISRSPISVGIVGLGRAGWDLHFNPLLGLAGFKIVSVADPLVQRCDEAASKTGCLCFESLDDLLSGSDAELIVIATPSTHHYADTLRVLNAGRHCVTEKPFALNANEARELIDVARRKNLSLFVHHTCLHQAEFYHFKQVIDSGVLGEIFQIRAFFGSYSRRWDWQTLKKNGGGQLQNTCPHVLSIVLPLLGAPVESVYADMRNIKDAGDAEDHVHLVLRTSSGVSADIVVSRAFSLGIPKWLIAGSRGALVSDGNLSRVRFYKPDSISALTVIDAAAPDREYLSETLPWEEKELEVNGFPVKSFHENVYEVLREGAIQMVSPESAFEVVRVSDLVQSAA